MRVTATIWDQSDAQIDVVGECCEGMRARRDCFGLQESPDDEPEMIIIEVTNDKGNEITLDEYNESRAIEALWENLTK